MLCKGVCTRFRFPFLQDSASCGGHSSSGSTSSLSTPPSVSQSPPQPQMNGVATVGVAGLMGALGAGSTLGMGGIVGALNGVIQTPAGTSSPHMHTTGAAAGVTLPVSNRYGWSMPSFYSSSFNPRRRSNTPGKYGILVAQFHKMLECKLYCILLLSVSLCLRAGFSSSATGKNRWDLCQHHLSLLCFACIITLICCALLCLSFSQVKLV